MKASIYIDNDKLGEVIFSVIDESMGGIGGQLIVNEKYKEYQSAIIEQCETKGISNIDDFNYRILLADNSELKPQGGIGITHLKQYEEIYVESAGIDQMTIDKIRKYK